MFIAKDRNGSTALHIAAEKSKRKLLGILMEWGKELLTRRI
jgi:hypothetical protein